jgi:tetratricopeptide (TPR) repeat protein
LDKLPTIKLNNSEDEGRRRLILAQAKIHRAWFYFQLANFYGTDYTSGTAASSLAVPLILVPGQVERPKRATVKEVYDQIIKDLKDAIATKELPAMGVDIIHPGLAAAHVLLARTYLYMGDYDNALKEAENGLAIKKELLNYKDVKSYPVTLLEQAKNPEIMLAKVGIDEDYYRYFGGFIRGDYELLESFGWNDKRKELAFPNYSNLFLGREGKMTFNYSIGVPEAMFIKAECLARKGQVDGALALLNEIRANRLSGTDNLTSNVNDILHLVFSEKRKEFIFHGGIRLFDLKRMNRDPKLAKTLKRVQRDQWSGEIEKEFAELVPNSPRYLMQIAPRIIQNNPAIIPNPR